LGTDERYDGQEEHLCHGVSENLAEWKFLDPILAPGARGDFDSYKVRSPGAVVENGCIWLFYTGVRRAKMSGTVRIGLAMSPDGDQWRKWPSNPVVRSRDSRNMWDPHVVWDPTRKAWIMYYTSRAAKIDYVGVATSDNLSDWTDHGTCLEFPQETVTSYCATESPCVVYNPMRDQFVMFLNHGTFESNNAVRGWGRMRRYTNHDGLEWAAGRSRGSYHPKPMPRPALRPRHIGYAGQVICVENRWFRTGIVGGRGYSHLRFFGFEWLDDGRPKILVD